jgi:hypothetical protein
MSKLLLFVGVALVSFQANATTVAAEFLRCIENPESICANFYGLSITDEMVQVTLPPAIKAQLLSETADGRASIVRNIEVVEFGNEIKVISLEGKDKSLPTRR